MHDGPELSAAKRLMDAVHEAGFSFTRIATGDDAPLMGKRTSLDYEDEIYLGGFSNSCSAIRRRRYSLIVPGGLPVAERVGGDAITVLHTVIADWAI